MFDWLKRLIFGTPGPAIPTVPAPPTPNNLRRAVQKAQEPEQRRWPVQPPVLPRGVVPEGQNAPVLAMDSYAGSMYDPGVFGSNVDFTGFAGYQYLAMLSTRAEYRAFASALSRELTREWITINSADTLDGAMNKKVAELTQMFTELRVQEKIQVSAEHDCYYGRGQIMLKIGRNRGNDTPLILSNKTIAKDTPFEIVNIEPMWTTPQTYNANDPSANDFYKPSRWWMMGETVHNSRLINTVTRPVADILKPAFNFGGMSLSQLAEPYVNNWLRTRQSVSDLVANFSITALKTNMSQVLQGGDDGTQLFNRAALFTATRSNKGMMLLDKEQEDLVQINTPLGGLHELQAQALEGLSTVSHIPVVKLTGVSPSGLNASSEGEIIAFEDWIASEQESHWTEPVSLILQICQLIKYGEIDPAISFTWNPLRQMTAKELADIRLQNATAANLYIQNGTIAAEEDRERLARDPESGYHGLDLNREVEVDEDAEADQE